MDLHLPVLLTLFCSSLVFGGKVLVFPMDGSHWLCLKVVVKELHSRGHNITVMCPEDSWFIKKSPLYKTINIKAMGASEQTMVNTAANMARMRREGVSFWMHFCAQNKMKELIHRHVEEMIGELFENQKLMQELKDANYDAVLTDPTLGARVLIAYRLGLPLVLEAKFTTHGEAHFAIAPSPLSYIPHMMTELTDKMTFRERICNMLAYLTHWCMVQLCVDVNYDALVQRFSGPDVHYLQLLQAADIWLMSSDFSLEFPRPTMPNVVYIAGFQCKPSKPLPQELEDFVQSSGEHGVIVMSLGTLVAQLPEDVVEEFAAAFAKLPQKVIWRHQGRKPSSLGNNTLLLDWLPQNDLLGHPKTKVFVAHGGLNGIQEAIYHEVPLVGLPLFDQPDILV